MFHLDIIYRSCSKVEAQSIRFKATRQKLLSWETWLTKQTWITNR